MPVYEFFCSSCNTIFSFFSRSVNTTTVPPCPKCRRRLKRQVSLFACIGGSGGEDEAQDDFPLDERRLEGAMSTLAAEADGLDESDPRQAGRLMRKFAEMSGVRLGPGMQEAMRRLEAGEDPDRIEAELGDALQSEDPFQPGGKKPPAGKRPPVRDETLYDL
jgi:putative FmdB family regulatory protein